MPEFEGFKKIPRLFRDIVITEKIDGTNAQILIQPAILGADTDNVPLTEVEVEGMKYYVWAGSKNRWIYEGKQKDNHGFAGWVKMHAITLVAILGEGRHYGEWWGPGIQRGYGLSDKQFSLFNVDRWRDLPVNSGIVNRVPILYEGPWFTDEMHLCGDTQGLYAPYAAKLFLREHGSVAAPGFDNPEGIVVFHTAANAYMKSTLVDDDKPKGQEQ